MVSRWLKAAAAAAVALSAIGSFPARAADPPPVVTNGTVIGALGDSIAYTLFQPGDASATNQVPVILQSHGWGGSRTTTASSFTGWLNDGFGVLSFDQRGHGDSGGVASVEDPDIEGQDVRAIIDLVASLDWVSHDLDGNGDPIADDPVLGAIGGSYGGGYQTMGALTDLRDRGATRFNALAPEITWYDLPESLAPRAVPRTLWTTLLYAAAPPHASYIDEGEAVGLATGWFPDGTVPGTVNLKQIFYEHSPKFFADNGMYLDIPVLWGQGITDNLFNLNQGVHNFLDVQTPAARSRSILVGYNGGHVLPEVLPFGQTTGGNTCVPNTPTDGDAWGNFRRAFFHAAFAGDNPRTELGAPRSTWRRAPAGACARSPSGRRPRRPSVPQA
jgi:hypothetical protein